MDGPTLTEVYDQADNLFRHVTALSLLGSDGGAPLLNGEDVAWLLGPIETELHELRATIKALLDSTGVTAVA